MGHTRMATQGSCHKNYNNHPFSGQAGETAFALAHNGVLYNDDTLRRKLHLPNTRIETDSYVAAQIIAKKKALSLDSLQFMAEQVRGSFSFTVLSESDNLYIIKGDSPFCLYYFPKSGLYIYCSTEEILQTALLNTAFRLEQPERLSLRYGDILQIDMAGNLERKRFQNFGEWNNYVPYKWRGALSLSSEEPYLEALKSVAGTYGFMPEDIERLYRSGFTPEEIEESLYNGEI